MATAAPLEPAPPPASAAAARPSGAFSEAFLRAHGCKEIPEVFRHLTEAHFKNEDAYREAWELYGGDADQELAALEAGIHPLQRCGA